MNDSFGQIYGQYGSLFTKAFGPVIAPRTYLRALHLLLMFPIGIAYFVGLVVTLTIGGALIWTLVGPVVLIVALYFSRWSGDAEAWLVRHVTQIQLRRPPTAIEMGQSFRSQLYTRLIDRNTWTGLIYLFAQFPIGIGIFVSLVVVISVGMAFVSAPIILMFSDSALEFGGVIPEIDTVSKGLFLVPIGLIAVFAGVHFVNVVSALHASWARLMLASKAKTIPTIPEGVGPSRQGPTVRLDDLTGKPEGVFSSRVLAPEQAGIASLTPRERDVLHLIAQGHSNAEIAEAFVISEGTVKTHVKRMLSKLDLRDRTQAAAYAYQTGFVEPDKPIHGLSEPIQLEERRAQ